MPVITKNDGFPITLKVPKQNFSKRFHTEEEVRNWIQGEIDFWERLNRFPSGNGFPGPNDNLGFLNAMTADILRTAHVYGEPSAQLSFIEEKGVLLSEGKQAKFLARLREEEPSLYPGAFAGVASTLLPINKTYLSQGNRFPLPWTLWASGLGGVLKFAENERANTLERRELDRLTGGAQALVEELETKFRELSALHESQENRLEELADNHVKVFEKTLSQYEAAFADVLKNSRSSIAEFEKMVRDRLVLEAPTKFWTEKAKSHRNVAIGFGILFLVAIGGGVFWITHFGVSLVADAYQTIVGNRENPGLLALVPLAFITLPTLAFAWMLRHISRIVVQNIGLQADAQLRGTIANTYTALTSQNAASPAELAIALNALFRPIDGSGHAEIAPPNIRDILEAGKP